MTDNRGDSPVDDLERALADMLRRRADSVHHSAVIPLSDVPRPPRWSRARTTTVVAAVAASVITLSAVGSVVLSHRDRHPSPNAARPSPCAASATTARPSCTTPDPVRTSPSRTTKKPAPGLTTCTVAPSALHSALVAGRVGVDQPINVGVGVGPDGTFLMDQGAYTTSGTPSHAELALFGPKHGQPVWLARNPALNVADVDPAGAVSKDWVVYAVRTTAQGPDAAIYAWRRTTGQTVTVRTLTSAEHRTLALNFSPPIVIGDIAYWVEESEEGSHQQWILGRNLTTGKTVLRLDVHNVDRLLNVGGVLAWVSSATDGSKSLLIGGSSAPVAVVLPTSAAGPASWISSDGSTVRWQTGTGPSTRVYSATVAFDHGRLALHPGAPATFGTRYENWESNAGPLFTFPGPSVSIGGTGDVVVDTQPARAMIWPLGTHLDLVSGDSVIVHIDGAPSGSSAPGSSSVSRISLAALRALPCH